MISIKEALAGATADLAGSSPTAELDARVLLEHVLDRNHAWLITRSNEIIDPETLARYETLIVDRRSGRPLAYITGWKEFWSLRLEVNPSVLIPRPETERLVELALARIPGNNRWHIADLGTGSGAVALAIGSERPRCQVTATDISVPALGIAKANASRLCLYNVHFRCGDWYSALAGDSFDLIVSNPPYIRCNEACLQQGDLAREPVSALHSGAEGLDALRVVAAGAREHLTPGGWVLVEHGYDQEHEVARIFEANGLHRAKCYVDHAGHPRVTEAQNDPCTSHAGV